jgi:hypothetical protein
MTLPGMIVGSRIPWSGTHEYGASISGKMLIPLHGRVGRKRFKAQVAKGSKEDIAEVARILAMQAAHYARTYGELPIPDLHHLLTDPHLDEEGIGLLRDGTMALVGVMATVVGLDEGETNSPLQ